MILSSPHPRPKSDAKDSEESPESDRSAGDRACPKNSTKHSRKKDIENERDNKETLVPSRGLLADDCEHAHWLQGKCSITGIRRHRLSCRCIGLRLIKRCPLDRCVLLAKSAGLLLGRWPEILPGVRVLLEEPTLRLL